MRTEKYKHASPLPWTYHREQSGSAFGMRDWIEDATGSIVVENVGHIDGPLICEAVNTHKAILNMAEFLNTDVHS